MLRGERDAHILVNKQRRFRPGGDSCTDLSNSSFCGGPMGVLSRKIKSRGRAPTLLRGVFKSMTPSATCVTAAPLESTNSRTASLLLEKCAQV
jgi:hypothetical protein